MQRIVTADSQVVDGVPNLLFIEPINQKAAKKAIKIILIQWKTSTSASHTTTVVTTLAVMTPKVTIRMASATTSVTPTSQIAKPTLQMKTVAAKAQKVKENPVTEGPKVCSFMKAQKDQTKIVVSQLLDAMIDDSESDSASETEPELE